MIRPLQASDRGALEALLAQAPEHTLYFQGNIETLGFAADFCRFWGDFDAQGLLRGALNRYFTGWGVYGLPDADWPALAARIDADAAASRLQDNPGGIPSILPLLRRHRAVQVDEEELMRLDAADFRPQPAPPGVVVRRATMADLPGLVGLYADAGSMTRSPAGVERPLRDTTVFVAVVGEGGAAQVVSAALTNAEGRALAMVGGVYTPPEWRQRGYSRAVCSALCAQLLAAGKQPILYWKMPSAGRVYRTLGFRPIGTWRAVLLAPRPQAEAAPSP